MQLLLTLPKPRVRGRAATQDTWCCCPSASRGIPAFMRHHATRCYSIRRRQQATRTRSRDSTACLKSYTFSCGCLQASQVQHEEMGDPEKNMTPAGQGLLRTARLYLACLATATNRAKAPMHLVNAILLLCSVLRSVSCIPSSVRSDKKRKRTQAGMCQADKVHNGPPRSRLPTPGVLLVRQGRHREHTTHTQRGEGEHCVKLGPFFAVWMHRRHCNVSI